MFNTKEKIALSILGTIITGCSIGAVYCYGRAQYYQGRIDLGNELKTEMGRVKKELYDKYGLTEEKA